VPGLAVFGLDFAVREAHWRQPLLDEVGMDQYSPTPQANEANRGLAPLRRLQPARAGALVTSFLSAPRFMWRNGARDIEVLKSEVDRAIRRVLEANGIIRHVQLKSSFRGSKVREVDVSTKLLRKPGGCVLWLEFDRESLAIERFYWFGGRRGPRCGFGHRVSRHSKGHSDGEKNERRSIAS